MATGENFTRICSARSEASKAKKIVDSKTEFKISVEINKLQSERETLYNNDELTDCEVLEMAKIINGKIETLINSKYETIK